MSMYCMCESTGGSWQQRNQRRIRKVRKEGEIFIWSHSASSSVWSYFIFWAHLRRQWNLRHLLAPAGDSRHRRPSGTSRKRWPEGNWVGFVSIHVSVGQMSAFVDSNTMHRATLCLALIKGKRGEEGPPGKQGSPVSDSCYIYWQSHGEKIHWRWNSMPKQLKWTKGLLSSRVRWEWLDHRDTEDLL